MGENERQLVKALILHGVLVTWIGKQLIDDPYNVIREKGF